MVLELAGIVLVGGYASNKIYQSAMMDDRALAKYGRAFEREEEARHLVEVKKQDAEKCMEKVLKRKRAILDVTMPSFIEVYGKIKQVRRKKEGDQLILPAELTQQPTLKTVRMYVKKEFSDKELLCGMLFHGMLGMMKKDSERYMSAASAEMSSANVQYAQAESIALVYDAVIDRGDRVAKLLTTMNLLFLKSIQQAKDVIEKNGLDVRNHNSFDEGVLMTCENMALAMVDLCNVPVIDESEELAQKAEKMIATGEENIKRMQYLMES